MKQLFFGLSLLLLSNLASSCPCSPANRLDDRVDRLLSQNGLVYTATVQTQQEGTGEVCRSRAARFGCVTGPVNQAQLNIDQVLLGSGNLQTLQYAQQADYCGMSLQPGQKLLIYATRLDNGAAETDQCRVFGPTDNEINLLKSRLGPNPAGALDESTPRQFALKMLDGFWPSDVNQVRVFDTAWGNVNGDSLPDLVAVASVADRATRKQHTWSLVPLIRSAAGFELYPPTDMDWCASRNNQGIVHVTDGAVGVSCYKGGTETVKKEFRWSTDEFVAIGEWEPFTPDRTPTADANPIVQPVVSESLPPDGPFDLNRATTEQLIRWVMEELGVADSLRIQTAEVRQEAEQLLLEFAPEKAAQWRPELERKLSDDRILTLLQTELEGTTQAASYRRVASWLESPVGRVITPVWNNWYRYLSVNPVPVAPPAPDRAAIYGRISSQPAGTRFFASHQLQMEYGPQLVTQGLFMSAEELSGAHADVQTQVQAATVNWREPITQSFLPLLLADLSDDDLQQFYVFITLRGSNDVFFWFGDAAGMAARESIAAAHQVIRDYVPDITDQMVARTEAQARQRAEESELAIQSLTDESLLDLANQGLTAGQGNEELLRVLQERFPDTVADPRALTTLARAHHAVGGGSRRPGSPLSEYDPTLFDRAEKLLRRALDINPNYTDAHLFLGWNQMQVGNFEAADLAFDRAAALSPGHERLPGYRMALAIAIGDLDRAKNYGIQGLTGAGNQFSESAFWHLATFVVNPGNARELGTVLEAHMNSRQPGGRLIAFYTQSMMENGLPTMVAARQFERFDGELSVRQREQYALSLAVHASEDLSRDGELTAEGIAMANRAGDLYEFQSLFSTMGRSRRGVEAIPVLYRSDINIKKRARVEATVLLKLAGYNMREEIRELVARGADVDTREMGFTALHAAAGNGHLELVRELLELGADPSAVGFQQRKPADMIQPDTPNAAQIRAVLEAAIKGDTR
ncbi:MAG: ankyrin repeat domain-containing protein [Pseudomonadota bacterium]